jgi:hypothetical protein
VERATTEKSDWFLNPLQSGLAIPKKAQNAFKISATVRGRERNADRATVASLQGGSDLKPSKLTWVVSYTFAKRLHSGEAATAEEGGVTRTVIKSLRGGRGGRQRVFAASSLDGAAREQYAAMEAGGGAVEAPPPKGAAQRPASRRPPREKIGLDLLGTIFFFFSFFLFFSPHQKFFFPKKESARS